METKRAVEMTAHFCGSFYVSVSLRHFPPMFRCLPLFYGKHIQYIKVL
nr:MAG TPA: hypothetical protein [Caudoviricetes sp.]